MKTKEEVIKEAWNTCCGFIPEHDKNGWVNQHDFKDKSFLNYKDFENQGNYFRPLSLKGIDDNFGWISIQSENWLKEHKINGLIHRFVV